MSSAAAATAAGKLFPAQVSHGSSQNNCQQASKLTTTTTTRATTVSSKRSHISFHYPINIISFHQSINNSKQAQAELRKSAVSSAVDSAVRSACINQTANTLVAPRIENEAEQM